MNEPTQLQSVHLRVNTLARSLDFYEGQLGFHVVRQTGKTAELATSADSRPLLNLTEDSAATAPPRDAAGLFHTAVLLPSRAALGHWLQQAAKARVEFDGFSDHGVSEALYLVDPDGNGLEFYADRPRSAWVFDQGKLQLGTWPLDVNDLVAAGATHQGAPLDGAFLGHLHLRVSALDVSESFYQSTLGMSTMATVGNSARFLAAGGYHHHLGLNTWGGIRVPQPPGRTGLVEAVFGHAGTKSEIKLIDPDSIAIRLRPLELRPEAAA